jgi:catechol 2,3-dioxygenase
LAETRNTNKVIGPVYLTVADLERTVNFYQNSLGFQVLHRQAEIANLGAGDEDLLVLHQTPDGARVGGTTGLYHFAILVPSRVDLANSLKRIITTNTPVQGFADHLVSEAIYLADPEGNGIEIYRDRPREKWAYEGDQIKMGTEPLDVEGLLADANENRDGLPSGTRMGHIHLHVSDIAEAEAFYTRLLSFDLVLRYGPSAAFFSVGGYHHHIGVNTWAGEGAPPQPVGALGLRHFVIQVKDEIELAQIAARAEEEGVLIVETELGLQLHDPSANAIVLTSKIV